MNDLINYPQGGVPADPQQMQDLYRKYAEAYASTERAGGSSISVRNGVMSVGDQPIPGNQFAGVILDAVRLNTFYMQPFNASNPMPPECYAIGRNDAEMAPHPDMQKDLSYFKPQAERCGACPHNEFGSGRTGTGKACSNRRKLLILVAGQYVQTQSGLQLQPQTDPEHYATSPLLTMTLAPTTLHGWGAWVRETAATYQRPTFGVIARIYLYPHPKHGKEAVGFETLAPTPDHLFQTILQRHQEAARDIFEGYDPPQARQQSGGGFHQQQAQVQQPQTAPPAQFQPQAGWGQNNAG